MEKENKSINLLDDKGKHASDIFLFWALYVGRLLVIITEAIALTVFLSRFSIDRKLIDYKDNIESQRSQVEFFKTGEQKFRKTQLKLKISDSYTASTSASVNFFKELLNQSNDQLLLSAISVSPSSLSVTAQASTVENLSSFTQKLKDHPLIESLSIDKVESKPKNALISVTITAKLKPK